MIGTEIAAQALVREVRPLAQAHGLNGPVAGPYLPQGSGTEGVVFYPEFSAYDSPMGQDINHERLRMVLKAGCKGTSTEPILAFMEEQLDLLHGLEISAEEYRGETYQLLFSANGELPITTTTDGAEIYRQLGTVYDIEVIRG